MTAASRGRKIETTWCCVSFCKAKPEKTSVQYINHEMDLRALVIFWCALCSIVFLLHLLTGHSWLLQMGVATAAFPVLPLVLRVTVGGARTKTEADSGRTPGFFTLLLLWMSLLLALVHLLGDTDSMSAEMNGPFSLLLPILENYWLAGPVLAIMLFISSIRDWATITKSARPDYSKLVGAMGVVTKWQDLSGTVHLDIQERDGYHLWPMARKKDWKAQSSRRLKPGDCVVVSSAGDKPGILEVEMGGAMSTIGGNAEKTNSFTPKWWQWAFTGMLLLAANVAAHNLGYDSHLFHALTFAPGLAALSVPLCFIMSRYSDNSFPAGKQLSVWAVFSLVFLLGHGAAEIILEASGR